MARGGQRPGAGRPKGTQNPATKRRREIVDKALKEGLTPLEVMLKAMRQALGEEGLNYEAAFPFARDAAPYMHPKLASTEMKLDADVTNRGDFSELTPEEWERRSNVATAAGAAEKPH